jgi:hypothetical protein
MEPTSEATCERARRLANLAMWTVALQCRRLREEEPEDDIHLATLGRLQVVGCRPDKTSPSSKHRQDNSRNITEA